MFHHGVEHRHPRAHARDQRHFRRLAGCAQSLIEGFDDGVAARRDYGTHIEDAAHDGAPAPNNASATQAPAVPIQRRHADQGSDLLMCQPAQLGQFSKERTTHHGPDARHAAQQIFLFTPEP